MAISTRFLLSLSFLCCLSQTACAVTETVRMDPCPDSDSMYQNRSHSVRLERVGANGIGGPCCPLLVAIPEDAGSYPVVQFQHGYVLRNTNYEGLITQVATWGFIVVAPQMYATYDLIPDLTTEIVKARSILDWVSNPETGLIASLPKKYANHKPNFDKVALAGHSRGGEVVFGLALNHGTAACAQNYSAIVGLDPVDGKPPTILNNTESSIDVGVPTLIVGTGLGSKGLVPCAPEDRGHIEFYRDLKPASFHFVATKYGHMDFTEDCSWLDKLDPLAAHCTLACVDGSSRECMRRFSAGIMVAFLQEVFFRDSTSFSAALQKKAKAPVKLDDPEWKGNISRTSEAHHQYADIY